MRAEFLLIPVTLILYLMLVCGLLFLFGNDALFLAKRLTLRRRLPSAGGSGIGEARLFLEDLVLSATGKKLDGRITLAGLFLILILVFILSFQSFSLVSSLIWALLLAVLPLLFLYSRALSRRNRGSREGISFISELYRQYRLNNLNILEALECCCRGNTDYPICKKLTVNLLFEIRSGGTGNISRAIDSYSRAMDTTWGYMLASSIKLSCEKGTDISAGLMDITMQLKAAAKRLEAKKRMNSEAGRMTVFLIPILYIGSLMAGSGYLGVGLDSIIKNQFFDPGGLAFFIGIITLFIVNLMLLGMVSSSRMDY